MFKRILLLGTMSLLLSCLVLGFGTKVDYYDTGDNDYWSAGTLQKAMIFTASKEYQPARISAKFYLSSSTSNNYVFSIQTTTADKPNGGIICSNTISGSTFTTVADGKWYNITLAGCTNLTMGTKYALVIDYTAANNVYWRYNTTQGYSGGNSVYNSGSWVTDVKDLMFRIFGDFNEVVLLSPVNNSIFNEDFVFNFVYYGFNADTCILYDNRTGTWYNRSTLYNPVVEIDNSFGLTGFNLTNNNYVWNVKCQNAPSDIMATSNFTLTIDTIDPIITFVNPLSDNSSGFFNNITLDISISDSNNYETTINITQPNGTIFFSESYNTSGINIYNITNLINMTQEGVYSLFIEAADGHTARDIEPINYTIIDNRIDFNSGELEIYSAVNRFDANTTKEDDKYKIDFLREVDTPLGYEEFYIESNSQIDIIEGSDYKGHLIVKSGSMKEWYWVDFETDEDYNVSVEPITDNQIRVRVYGNASLDYMFNSVGRLNIVSQNLTYYFDGTNVTLTETFDSLILDQFQTEYILNASYNKLLYNASNVTAMAYLQFEDVNYTAELRLETIDYSVFNVSIFINESSTPITVDHKWHFLMEDVTGTEEHFNTTNVSQTVNSVSVGECGGTLTYQILDSVYKDEGNESPIIVDNGYNLAFYDGTYYYNLTGSFSGATVDHFCTNLNPANLVYNWDVTGYFILSKSDYVTRIYTFVEGNEITVSNSPKTEQDLYLITIANSSTITYTWRSNQYQMIDGIMEVSRCNLDGSKDIVESVPIVGGAAVANLNLLTTPYSYSIIVNGVKYESDSFTTCHIESNSEVSYFVDLTPVDVTPVLGLLFIDCSVIKLNDTAVRMTWEQNPFYDATITGCLVGYRFSNLGMQEIYRNCTSATTYSLERTIPDSGFTYMIRGELTQDGNMAFCDNTPLFYENQDVANKFGLIGILSIALFLIALVLFYSNSGEKQIFGLITGLVAVFFMNISKFNWVVISSMIGFLVIIWIIGRYSKK